MCILTQRLLDLNEKWSLAVSVAAIMSYFAGWKIVLHHGYEGVR